MRRRRVRWREALGVALLLGASAGPAAPQGSETFSVKGLRTEKVTLYDCNQDKDKRKAVKDVARVLRIPAQAAEPAQAAASPAIPPRRSTSGCRWIERSTACARS